MEHEVKCIFFPIEGVTIVKCDCKQAVSNGALSTSRSIRFACLCNVRMLHAMFIVETGVGDVVKCELAKTTLRHVLMRLSPAILPTF